jgi:hypothetical protein
VACSGRQLISIDISLQKPKRGQSQRVRVNAQLGVPERLRETRTRWWRVGHRPILPLKRFSIKFRYRTEGNKIDKFVSMIRRQENIYIQYEKFKCQNKIAGLFLIITRCTPVLTQ